jgi:small subunit ribosomal protein S8
MSMQDTVSDMLTRIRNAKMASHPSVTMPTSKFKMSIAKLLKEEGFIQDAEVVGTGVKKLLKVVLKEYNGKSVIEFIKRVSTPGLRVYKKKDDLPQVQGGLGIAIISTSKGIMTDKQARKQGYGGEVICIVA